jgi:peroxiredoxin
MKWMGVFGIAVCLGATALGGQSVHRKAGEFTVALPSGKDLQLSSYRGKVVLVQFLYTTCPHCRDAARMYGKLQAELGPQGLQVVGVAFNPEVQGRPDVINNFETSNSVGFPVGVASAENVLSYLGISIVERYVVPQIVVIDRKGMIRAQSEPLGTAELQDESYMRTLLDGLLKENRTTKSRRLLVAQGF